WTSGLTFSINHNEVTKLYSESSAISGINGSETLTYTMVGEPVGQFYGYKVIGMFKEEGDFYKKGADGNFLLDETGNRIQVAIPKDQTIGKSGIWVGDYIYEDRDNNGVIDEKDRTFLGNPAPKFTFGFNNYLSYKGFDLNIFLNGSVGNKAINLIRRTFTDPMRNSNLLKEATGIAQIAMHDPEVGDEVLSNVYVANADAAKVQRITTSSANDNNRISDRFVEDASYLRIKNISLGYTFPQKWLRRLQIDHLRLYVNIQNLCTITGYKGYDPEIGALNYNVLLRGVDDARYPSQRIYTFGLNFNF
ncbi:TonB-dependent receptor, partial [Bacteroides uniformis]